MTMGGGGSSRGEENEGFWGGGLALATPRIKTRAWVLQTDVHIESASSREASKTLAIHRSSFLHTFKPLLISPSHLHFVDKARMSLVGSVLPCQ